jgi:DHA1 family bicyclomycin/chloramphenicol resistance-like MFS transporter
MMSPKPHTTPNKKIVSLSLLGALMAITPLAIDLYLPAIPIMAESFNSTISVMQNSISIYLLGYGLGMLLFGPLSDRYGRRPPVFFGLVGFSIISVFLIYNESSSNFLFLRFLQAVFGGAATVSVPAILRDCYGKDMARAMSYVSMILVVAPMVAPLIGSFLLLIHGWKLIFVALTAYGVILLLITSWILPETSPPTLSHHKPISFLKNYAIVFSERSIHWDLISAMLGAIAFFTYITSISFIFISYFGVSATSFGVLFGANAISSIIGSLINAKIVSRFGPRKLLHWGLAFGAIFSAALVVVNILQLNVYWTVACLSLLMWSFSSTSVNIDSLVIIKFAAQASTAAGVLGTLRFFSGAFAGPLLAILYNGTPLPAFGIIFGALLTSGICQYLGSLSVHKTDVN